MKMLEKVARRLAEKTGANPDEMWSPAAPHHAMPRWRWHLEDARVALDALYEPSDDMLNKGMDVVVTLKGERVSLSSNEARECWQRMIGVASREP